MVYQQMKSYLLRINGHLCDGCGDCYIACPMNAGLSKKSLLTSKNAVIIIENGKAKVNTDTCDGCGVCINICHKKAIELIMKGKSNQ
jgi:4Fe-4S ferredoxin